MYREAENTAGPKYCRKLKILAAPNTGNVEALKILPEEKKSLSGAKAENTGGAKAENTGGDASI